MRFTVRNIAAVMLVSALLLFVRTASAQLPAEQIFPDTTKGFFVIASMKDLADQWKQTQFGVLMSDPIMGPFKDDLQKQFAKRMEDRFGLTLDGIEKLPSGELAVGMIAVPNKTPGFVFTMDVTDRLPETEKYIEKLSQKLVAAKAVRTEETFEGEKMTVFTLPPPNDEAVRVKPESPKNNVPPLPPLVRKFHYTIKNNHLIVSDQPYLLKLICDRTDSPGKDALSSVEDFQIVKKRLDSDVPEGTTSVIRWYVEPFNYGESVRSLLRGPAVEKRRNKPSAFTILKEQGFDAIQGVGGVIGIKNEGKEVVHRTFIHAKKPFRLAMQMLNFPMGSNFQIPNWMPADIARCTQVYVDPLTVFDNFGTLFDALVMQGEEGVWKDIIDGFKTEENGPQIDLREELVVHLGQRVMGMSRYQKPITIASESVVVALELKEGRDKEVTAALKKLFGQDPEMMQNKYKTWILWQRVPAEDEIKPFGAPVGAAPIGGSKKKAAAAIIDEIEDETTPPIFPDGAITVAKGCLFVSTNGEYLKEILDRLDQTGPNAADNDEYKEVDQVFADLGIADKPHFLQFYARTDETLHPTYEMVRQGKLPQSQAILAKAINALAVPEDGSVQQVRPQAIDGSKLPEFELIRKYFGPAGFFGIAEDDGFFIKGFLLEKKNARAEKKAEPTEKKADEPEKKDGPAADQKTEQPTTEVKP